MTSARDSIAAQECDPLVSVLIVSYNGRKYLQACLDSVLDQDFPRDQYQVILIDNASRDGSADFVQVHFPSVRVIRLDRNYGPNKAIMMVGPSLRSKYHAYLNQDIVAHRRWLVELLEVISTHPEAGVVESNMILPIWSEYKGLRREGLIERAYVCDVTVFGTYEFRTIPVTTTTQPVSVLAVYGAGTISNPAVLAKLDHVLDSDFFAYADDLDLGLRLNMAGYRVLLAPRSVVYHDTDWHFKWDKRSLKRALWVTENTIIAFYKCCYWSEFLILLPFLLLGKLLKAGENSSSRFVRVLYAFAAIPLLLVGLARALIHMPRFRERRRGTLAQRKMPSGWIVNRLLHPGWEPDPQVWKNLADAAEVGSGTGLAKRSRFKCGRGGASRA